MAIATKESQDIDISEFNTFLAHNLHLTTTYTQQNIMYHNLIS